MFYFNKKASEIQFTTESWLKYRPIDITVMLDDILIGTYTNESSVKEYTKIKIPQTDLANLQCKTYIIKLIENAHIFKVELVDVVANTDISAISPKTNNTIVYYE